MSRQRFEAFLKILEYSNFTKAAEALGYTQSAMSQMIGAMEKEWGMALFVRDRTGVRLTSEAQRVLPFIRDVCNAYRELEKEIGELHGLESGTIKIAAISSIGQHWLPKLIKIFRDEHPNIDFDLYSGTFYQEVELIVESGQADIGFTRLPAAASLESLPLTLDRLLLLLPPDHPLAGCDRVPVEKLNGEPFILPARESETDVGEFLKNNDIHPQIRFTAWDDYSIISMVENDLGVSILPELILHRTPYSIRKKELDRPAYRRLGVVMKDSSRMSTATKRFMDLLYPQL